LGLAEKNAGKTLNLFRGAPTRTTPKKIKK
jgi:hypothetical protein